MTLATERLERLKAVDAAGRFLTPGVSFAALDAEANAVSDLESARCLQVSDARAI